MPTIVAPSAPQAATDENFGGPNATQMAAAASMGKMQPVVPIAPAATKASTATEPTVLTSTNISDNVIPANVAAAAELNNKGTYIGQDGNTYHSDGTLAYTGETGQAPGIDNPDNDPDIAHINDQLGGLKAITDASTKQSLDATHQTYAVRAQMLKEINDAQLKTRRQLDLNNGSSRYAQQDAGDLMTAQEKTGMAALGNLEAQESAAIAKVNAAQAKGDQQAMNSAIKNAQAIRKTKQAAADKLNAAVQKNTDAVAKTHTQMLRDQAIAGVVKSGMSDPQQLLKTLNTGTDGKDNGNNYTLKEINSALGALKPKGTTSTDLYKFSNAETGKLLTQGFNATQIQGIADDLNGRGDGTTLKGLTTAQQNAVSQIMAPQKVANTKPLVSGSLNYTNETLGQTSKWLNQTKGPDSYVDPTAYQKAFDAWTGDGGLAKDFLTKFPPKQYVNPANTWLPSYLLSKGASTKAPAADISSQINALFSNSKK